MVELVPFLRAALHPFMKQPVCQEASRPCCASSTKTNNVCVCANKQKDFASLELLDNVCDDIGTHVKQIFDKFCSIIAERLQAHLGDAAAYSAALLQQEQAQDCTAQMARFVKELCSLHRVLDQYLSPEQMAQVFAQVFGVLEQRYAALVGQLDATNTALVDRVERDAAKLASTAKELKYSPGVLAVVAGAVAQAKAACEVHQKAQQDTTPTMQIVDEAAQVANQEQEQEKHEDDEAPTQEQEAVPDGGGQEEH